MKRLAILAVLALAAVLVAQPPTTSWPTYHGDNTGRRFSPLTRINDKNVSGLATAWSFRTSAGGSLKSTPLMVDGILYLTAPDHVWAVDARNGKEIWHKAFETKGGWHIGNRGVGITGNWLFFLTPDCQLISLNLKDGSERWRKQICDLDQFYYGSMAPMIVKNHVIAGVSGDDLDRPGYLTAYDPETGDQKWRWSVVPLKKGDPGSETWPNEEAMRHGGGMTWQMPTYDPDLNLIYVTTGNPQPVIAHANRKGDNLFTGCIVALNPDTGKMVWYFQASPHDTHDWDSTQMPVLIDGEIDGQPRKLLAQAARNGYFFLLDRTNGKNIVTAPYAKPNWAKGIRPNGYARSRSREAAAGRWRARHAQSGRRHQLAAAHLQPADRAVLREYGARLQRVLHFRSGSRQPAGLGRHRSRRREPQFVGGGDRLQDRQDPLVPQVGDSRGTQRPDEHGRQPRVHRR